MMTPKGPTTTTTRTTTRAKTKRAKKQARRPIVTLGPTPIETECQVHTSQTVSRVIHPLFPLELASYHTAGHLLVAHLVGVRVLYTTVIPRGESLCRTAFLPYAPLDETFGQPAPRTVEERLTFELHVRRYVMARLGGIAAQTLVAGEVWWELPGDDLREAERAALRLNAGHRQVAHAYLEWLYQATCMMLDTRNHLKMLDRLARKLIQEPMLSGEWAEEVIGARRCGTR